MWGVAPFYMAKYEVTQKLWREVTGKNPSNFSGDNLPVESVTWLEAVEFCNALRRRDGHLESRGKRDCSVARKQCA